MPSAWGHTRLLETDWRLITQESHCFSCGSVKASIVAMNYITNFLYEAMDSILAVILLHGLNNTMSFLLLLLFPGTPFTLLTCLMAWAFVWWIEKKHGAIIQAVNGKAGS